MALNPNEVIRCPARCRRPVHEAWEWADKMTSLYNHCAVAAARDEGPLSAAEPESDDHRIGFLGLPKQIRQYSAEDLVHLLAHLLTTRWL